MGRHEVLVRNKGVEIHAIEFNQSSERRIPVLIVPGAINSAEEIEADLGGKLERHHVIISLRGRGKSGSPQEGYTLGDQASDIVAMMNRLELPEAVLFGHSLGSSVAIEAAGNMPGRIKGIIMGDFPPFYPPYGQKWVDRVLSREERHITATAVQGLADEATQTNLSDTLRQLEIPMLLIKGGEEDSLMPEEHVEQLKKIVPDVQIRILPDSGHDIFQPDPAPLVEEIERFVREIEEGIE